MELQPYTGNDVHFNQSWHEQILLRISDIFEIRIIWDGETAVLTGAFALAGGIIGGFAGGRMGAVVGSGLGGAAGLGVSRIISLREIWSSVKEQLKELLYIIFNYLRRIDPVDCVRAFEIFIACTSSRRELVLTLLDIIAQKLGRQVLSNIAAA